MDKKDYTDEHLKLIDTLQNPTPEKIQDEIKEQTNELNTELFGKVRNDINLKLDSKTGNSTVIYGSSKAGKSTLMMYLYKKYYVNDISTLFTESPQIDLYKSKNLIVAPAFFPEVVKEAHMINKKTKNKYNFTFMLDDIVDQKENDVIRKMILILRNSNISSITSLQSPVLLQKANRSSVNNIMFFKFNTAEQIEQIIRFYLNGYLPGKMDDKINLYRQLTADHHFLYYNPRDNIITRHKIII